MQPIKKNTSRREWIVATSLILILSAVAYLLFSGRTGFTSDDWYLVYAGLTGGLAKFQDVFAGDRPFRAYFAWPVFSLFGLRPQLYLLFSYALRAGGALAFYWLLHLAWPQQSRLNVALAALYSIYPGWMDQFIPFDIQAHLLGVGAMLLSFAFSLRALSTRSAPGKSALTLAGVVCQLLSLAMMEYYIGMEGLRFALLVMLVFAGRPLDAFRRSCLARWKKILAAWLPYLLGAGAFMFWRVFLFDNTRGATDISAMFAGVASSPLLRGLWAFVYLVQDFLNVTVMAWFIPLNQLAFNLRLRESLPAILLGLAMGGITWLVLGRVKLPTSSGSNSPLDHTDPSAGDRADGLNMLWTGSLGVIAALAPVVFGSRHVVFPIFSRFTLPASAGGILVLGGLLLAFGWPGQHRRVSIHRWAPAILVALAVMFQYANAIYYANGWDTIRDFWWQVSWRAPQIEPETVLVADYPDTGILEDYYVWGPANLIYYPNRYAVDNVDRTPLAAVVLTGDAVHNIRLGHTLGERERRGLTSTQDLSRVLMLSMPNDYSCVHLIEGRYPELSDRESDKMTLVAPYSDAGLVQINSSPHTPPAELFGLEPGHTWCYYYQKASLARQGGNWAEVARLGDEAQAKNERPSDRVEWMPFVQAYAYLGRYEDADRLAVILIDTPFLKFQACDLFTSDKAGYGETFPEGQQYLQDKFCN